MGWLSKAAPIIGAGVGALMGNPALGAQLGGAAGALLGGTPDVSGMYNTAAGQYAQNAQLAAFRPVGITTSFGQSKFEVDPTTGMLKSAGYTLNPQLQALQSSLLGGYGSALQQAQNINTTPLTTGAQSLFNLGQGYLAESPEAARQRYISQQQDLLAPQQEQTLANIRNRLAQTGRTGLATGGTAAGNMAQTNPEMAAYYNALANQERQIAAGAEQAAQQQQTFGAGLLSGGANLMNQGYGLQTAAYSPLQTQLGLGSSIESLGQQPLDIGAQLGGRSATAGQNMAGILNQGAVLGLQGAKSQADINAAQQTSLNQSLGSIFSNPSVSAPTSNWFNNLLGVGTGFVNM